MLNTVGPKRCQPLALLCLMMASSLSSTQAAAAYILDSDVSSISSRVPVTASPSSPPLPSSTSTSTSSSLSTSLASALSLSRTVQQRPTATLASRVVYQSPSLAENIYKEIIVQSKPLNLRKYGQKMRKKSKKDSKIYYIPIPAVPYRYIPGVGYDYQPMKIRPILMDVGNAPQLMSQKQQHQHQHQYQQHQHQQQLQQQFKQPIQKKPQQHQQQHQQQPHQLQQQQQQRPQSQTQQLFNKSEQQVNGLNTHYNENSNSNNNNNNININNNNNNNIINSIVSGKPITVANVSTTTAPVTATAATAAAAAAATGPLNGGSSGVAVVGGVNGESKVFHMNRGDYYFSGRPFRLQVAHAHPQLKHRLTPQNLKSKFYFNKKIIY